MRIITLLLLFFSSDIYSHGIHQHDFSPTPRDFAVAYLNGVYRLDKDALSFRVLPGKSLRFLKLTLKCDKSTYDQAQSILNDVKLEISKIDERYKLKNYLLIEEDIECSKT